jgi:hypothetical protein
LREGLHAGFLYGNKTSFGGYVGSSIDFRGFSMGLNLKSHFKRNKKDRNYSPFYFRLASGILMDDYNFDFTNIYMHYLATTVGRDFQISKPIGLSFEIGVFYIAEDDAYVPHFLPAVGLKLFMLRPPH